MTSGTRSIACNADSIPMTGNPCPRWVQVFESFEYRARQPVQSHLHNDREMVYVLHIFVKKSQRTLKKDLEIARKRLSEIRRIRKM